jgi:hypothetical protein
VPVALKVTQFFPVDWSAYGLRSALLEQRNQDLEGLPFLNSPVPGHL